MDLGLGGKVAVITGGSIGIGLAVAEGLAAEGATSSCRGPAGRAAQRGGEARRHGSTACARSPVACDVATADGCDALVATA